MSQPASLHDRVHHEFVRSLRRIWGGFASALLVAGLAAGCGDDPVPEATVVVDLPTSDWTPGDGVDGSVISGGLHLDESRCPYLLNNLGFRPVVWPAGFTARITQGRLVLLDSTGEPIASQGDSVSARAVSSADLTRVSTGRGCVAEYQDLALLQSPIAVTHVEPGSPLAIKQLADSEASVGDIDVCAAIRDAGAEVAVAAILDASSVMLESDYSESEEAYTSSCSVTETGVEEDTGLQIAFMQGTEFKGADADDPVIYPGCRIARTAPSADVTSLSGVRVTCGRALTVDVSIEYPKDSAIPPWTSGADAQPSERYVELVRDVLGAVALQH